MKYEMNKTYVKLKLKDLHYRARKAMRVSQDVESSFP